MLDELQFKRNDFEYVLWFALVFCELLVKMELFHSTRQYFETMGIYDWDAFHWKNLIFLFATLQLVITSFGFIVLSQAANMAENTFAFYQAISGLDVMFLIVVVIWKKRNVFELIHSFESFIDKSER